MSKTSLAFLLALLCIAPATADLPAPTEEQIEAKLKEVRKKAEAIRAEEKALLAQLEDAKQSPRGRIKADVEGVLCWRDEGGGYFIRVRTADEPKSETRVWLLFGEDKITGKHLAALLGKDVIAKGTLQQTPTDNTGSHIPAGGMYLTEFEVVGVKSK